MNKRQLVRLAAASAAFVALSVAPQLRATASALPDNPQQGSNTPSRPKVSNNVMDYLTGLDLTDEQKAKITKIQQEQKSHYDAIVKAVDLDTDKKLAMLQGYRRLENAQVFDVLTPEQQAEVRRRFRAAKHPSAADQKPAAPLAAKP